MVASKSLADMLIEMIQANREEINRIRYGHVEIVVQNHIPFEMRITNSVRYIESVTKPIDTN